MTYTEQDLIQFQKKSISVDNIDKQLFDIKNGYEFLKINNSATYGSGILTLNKDEHKSLLSKWDNFLRKDSRVVKFVPASGAASRMFKDLFEYADSAIETSAIKTFFAGIHSFAFYNELNDKCISIKRKSIDELIESEDKVDIVKLLLNKEGLNYGALPKGLLKFHSYELKTRTAFEEHLVEGVLYTKNKKNEVNVHFTVSPEHKPLFQALVDSIIADYEVKYNAKFYISFSEQKKSTDTVAATADNQPFRELDGSILFRPGGHGALIENLNDIDADIVFIKNIDNVVPDNIKSVTVEYKSLIAGILVDVQDRVFNYLRILDSGNVSNIMVEEMLDYCESILCVSNNTISHDTDAQKIEYLKNKFNRPIRVCGMVKNEGEPGGGPFIAYNSDGTASPQILESSQIDTLCDENIEMMNNSTHFNPVDLVCAIRNYKGEKFNLVDYVDANTGFISQKSKNGKELKALELPGLWNGAMSDWNTIFVEVPVETFNPVKTVNDLLREQHR